MKLSKGQDSLSHILQGITPEDMHNATFGTFATNFPRGINSNFNAFQILHISMKPVHVFLSNFTFELLGKKCAVLVDNERKISNILNFFKMREP